MLQNTEQMPVNVAENEIVHWICRRSFYRFVQEFWKTIIPEKPVWNWHIEYLCGELQQIAELVFRGEPKQYDLIVNVPPGSTKSTIVSVMFPAWAWTQMPQARIICGSYSHDLAMDFSRKNRDVVQSTWYQKCFPDVTLKQDQNTKTHFANTKGGERYSTGTGGAVTGKHAHFLIIDDPVNPMIAASDAGLKAANDWMDETLPTRTVDANITPTILIMQRLHQNDPTGHWLEKGEKGGMVKHICLPADISEGQEVKPAELRERYVNDLLDVLRLPKKKLEQFKVKLGPYGYACQYDQLPVPKSGGLFNVDRIRVGLPHSRIVKKARFWDFAASFKKGDYTVGVLMGTDEEGGYWVMDVVRGQWDTAERRRIMRETAEHDGIEVSIGFEQEGGSSGKDVAFDTVKMLTGYSVAPELPTGSKETRATLFSSQVNIGNVWLQPAAWNRDYLSELRVFPLGKHDDQVDASSGVFRCLQCRTGTIKQLSNHFGF